MLTYESFLFPVPPKIDWSLALVNHGIVREVSDLLALKISNQTVLLSVVEEIQLIVVSNQGLICFLNFAESIYGFSLSIFPFKPGNYSQIFNGDSSAYFDQYKNEGSTQLVVDQQSNTNITVGEFSMICFE